MILNASYVYDSNQALTKAATWQNVRWTEGLSF